MNKRTTLALMLTAVAAPALALRGMLDDPKTGALTIHLSAQGVRYLRLRQTGADPVVGWAVAELAVFGR